ncbi:MAG: hypothetical protein Q7J67_02070 [bacterium]|nr:hypothetical protein [bacterium]
MNNNVKNLFLFGLVLVLLSGCTIVHPILIEKPFVFSDGETKQIPIKSHPRFAKVYVKNTYIGDAPLKVYTDDAKELIKHMKMEKDGYYPIYGNKKKTFSQPSGIEISWGIIHGWFFDKIPQKRITALLSKAESLYLDKKYEDAIAHCKNVLMIDQDNKDAQKLMAKLVEEQKMALERQRQKEISELLAKANALYSDEKYNGSITQCKRILVLDKSNKDAQKLIVKLLEEQRKAKEWAEKQAEIEHKKKERIRKEKIEKLLDATKREATVKEDLYDFRKTVWGMSRKQVKATEDKKPVSEFDIGLAYKVEIDGKDFLCAYYFLKDKLCTGIYVFVGEHFNDNLYIDDYKELKEILIKKYGSPKTDLGEGWLNDLLKDDRSQWGTAVSMGHLVYGATWDTPTTEISLILRGDNLKISLKLGYESKEFKEGVSQINEKKTLKNF